MAHIREDFRDCRGDGWVSVGDDDERLILKTRKKALNVHSNVAVVFCIIMLPVRMRVDPSRFTVMKQPSFIPHAFVPQVVSNCTAHCACAESTAVAAQKSVPPACARYEAREATGGQPLDCAVKDARD